MEACIAVATPFQNSKLAPNSIQVMGLKDGWNGRNILPSKLDRVEPQKAHLELRLHR